MSRLEALEVLPSLRPRREQDMKTRKIRSSNLIRMQEMEIMRRNDGCCWTWSPGIATETASKQEETMRNCNTLEAHAESAVRSTSPVHDRPFRSRYPRRLELQQPAAGILTTKSE